MEKEESALFFSRSVTERAERIEIPRPLMMDFLYFHYNEKEHIVQKQQLKSFVNR